MIIPKFWAIASSHGTFPNGKSFEVKAWNYSDLSQDDALQKAKQSASTRIQKILSGDRSHCHYPSEPVREEIIKELLPASAIVTRNRQGVLVLNTADLVFVDIDRTQSFTEGVAGFLRSLVGLPKSPHTWEDRAVNHITKEISRRPKWGARLYKTKGGLRVMITHNAFVISSPEIVDFMKSCGVDPLYLNLCKVQNSFRARLTPKPARIKLKLPKISYPYANNNERERVEKWTQQYKISAQKFQTCELLAIVGNRNTHSNFNQIISYHDDLCGVGRGLPLA